MTTAVERKVADLYRGFWVRLPHITGAQILEQFLYSVGVPGEWFRGKRALDVGCGSGFAVWALSSLGAECYACDLGYDALRTTRDRLDAARCSAGLATASALALPYATGQFDFVNCNGVLHHTLDPRRGFEEVVRVTRPGGTVFVGLYGRGGIFNAGLVVGRLAARVVPYRLTEAVVCTLFGRRHVPHSFMPATVSILDNLYVPIRRRFRPSDVIDWFCEAGFDPVNVVRTKTQVVDHTTLLNRILYGDGYLQFRGRKAG